MRSVMSVVAAVVWATGASCLAAPTLLSLEGAWRFRTDPGQIGEAEGWASAEYDDSGWADIQVPGMWETQGFTETYEGMPAPTLDLPVPNAYNGVAWYRLRFVVPTEWAGVRLTLVLGAVDDHDQTHLNGALLGATGPGLEHPSLAARAYEIPAGLARVGEENVLVVRVTDLGGPGGIVKGPVTLVPSDIAARIAAGMADPAAPLETRFASPPARSRVLKIVHGLPDDPGAREALLLGLAASGFGGIVCNVSFDEYLKSEAHWEAFLDGVRRAKELGMALWLYDEQGYPSGTAGGQVLEGHPEWEAHGLYVARASTEGGSVDLELPPGEIVSAVACAVENGLVRLDGAEDLSARIADGRLRWDAPGPREVFVFTYGVLYECTHADNNVYKLQPYTNLLDPAPTARFLELTHEAYAARIPDLGATFESTFADEPSLMSVFLRPYTWPVLPWCDGFAESFREAKGYNLIPFLPALAADAGAAGHRARCDFRDHVAQLTADGFFGQIEDWCDAHGIPSGGHLIWEEDVDWHAAFYGDFMRCAERLTYPGIDCLTSVPETVPWWDAKLLGSIADLKGAPVVMSETSDHVQRWRPEGDERPVVVVTRDQIVGTCNLLYVAGVNTTTSYYSWADRTTEEISSVNEHVGRCGTLLRGSKPVTDVALLYPIESVWASMTPAVHGPSASPGPGQINNMWRRTQAALFENQRDFTILSSRALAKGEVREGRLHTGPLSFSTVVLPSVDTLPVEAWRKLAALVEAGGTVIAVDRMPRHSLTAMDAQEIAPAAQALFDGTTPGAVYIPAERVGELAGALASRVAPDVRVEPQPSAIRCTHRLVDGRDAYFLVNSSGEAVIARCSFAAVGPAEIWDPATGERHPAAADDAGATTTLDLELGPYGAVFVVFGGGAEQ